MTGSEREGEGGSQRKRERQQRRESKGERGIERSRAGVYVCVREREKGVRKGVRE